jgi:hypothetical protein
VRTRYGVRSGVWYGSIGLGVLLAASTACDDLKPFDPCPQSTVQERAGQLDGTWDIERVYDPQGAVKPLPYRPIAGKPQLLVGNLAFQTTKAQYGGDCTDLVKTEGIVIASYEYDPPPNEDWYSGRYVFDHKGGFLTLRAGKYTRTATVLEIDGERVLRAYGSAGEFKKEWSTLGFITVEFQKRPF